MADATTGDPLWSKRWLLCASEIVTLGAVALIAATHHDEWNWALFDSRMPLRRRLPA